MAGSAEGPVRSHSVGSLMDLDQPSAERRIRDFVNSTKTESRGIFLVPVCLLLFQINSILTQCFFFRFSKY